MADQIVIMDGGRIEQLGTPTRALRAPRDGVRRRLPRRLEPSLRRGRRRGNRPARRTAPIVRVPRARLVDRTGHLQIGVRPEKLRHRRRRRELARRERSPRARTSASRRSTSSTRRPGRHRLCPERPSGGQVAPGERLTLSWSPESTFVVDAQEGADHDRSHHPEDLHSPRGGERIVLTVPGLLAACGGGGGGGGTSAAATTQQLAKTLHFSNWTLYMDRNLKKHTFPSLIAFQKKTGTHVDYVQDINDNESSTTRSRRPGPRAVDRPRHRRADGQRPLSRAMLEKGYPEKLDKSAIPNMKNLLDVQKHPSFDPNRDYTLPWQSGMTGLAYNDKLTGPGAVGGRPPREHEAEGQDHRPQRMGTRSRS